LTILPNSVGLPALPFRITSVDGSNRLTILFSAWVSPAKTRALELTQRIVSQYGQSDWALRAQSLMFYIQQGVPTFGNTTD